MTKTYSVQFSFLIGLIALSILLIQCSKSSSPSPPGNGNGNGSGNNGIAVFTLQGSGSSCSNASVNGTYTLGTLLSSSNTVSVQVNVTTAGTWTISTNTVSGFSFSGSGTFASVGIQTVNLSGTGTPGAPGSQTFTVTAGSSTCTFQVTVNGSGPCDNCGITQIKGIKTVTYYYFNQVQPATSLSTGVSWTSQLDVTTTNPIIEEKIYNLGLGTITTSESADSKYIDPSNIFNGTTDQIESVTASDTAGKVYVIQRRTDNKDMIAASGPNPAINKRIFIISKTPSGSGGSIILKNIPVTLANIVSVIQNPTHASNPVKQSWKRTF